MRYPEQNRGSNVNVDKISEYDFGQFPNKTQSESIRIHCLNVGYLRHSS